MKRLYHFIESTLVCELCEQEKAMNNNTVFILCPHFLAVYRMKTGRVHKTAKMLVSNSRKNSWIFYLEITEWYYIVIKYLPIIDGSICDGSICRWKHLWNSIYPQIITCSFQMSTIISMYRNERQWGAEFSIQ